MVIHPLVVISFNKTLPRLKANVVESASLRASQFVLYLLSTSCVLTLASSTLFPLVLFGILYCCSVPANAREFTRSYQEYEDFQAFVSQSTSLWRPAQLFFLLFSQGTPYCCSVPGDAEEFTQSYQEYEDFQAFVSQSTSLWCPASERLRTCILRFRCIRHFVINIINNFRTRFIMSFYVICAVIYCSFYCIYM